MLPRIEKLHPACEVAARSVLPIFTSLVAKEPIEKYNFTQLQVAEKLGDIMCQFLKSLRRWVKIQ